MRTYGRLLRRPSTALALLAAFIGAVPIGMWPLTVVLTALARGGSAVDAGLVAAVFGVGNALGVVTQGALLARVRTAPLLIGAAAVGVPAVLLLQGPWSLAGAALAGLAIPAITPAVRGRFAGTLPGADRPGAYALVNVLFQAGIALGPLLAAGLAASGRVALAPPLAAAGGIGAAVLLVAAHRGAVPATARAAAPRTAATGSRSGVLALLLVAGSAGFGIGTLQVLLPVRSGATTAGAAFAVLALAEVAGAVLVGGRVGPHRAVRLLLGGTAAMAAVYGLLATGLAAVPLAVALGLATAVQSLGTALVLDRFVAPQRVPAVFAVQVAVLILAAAAGSLLAGAVPGAAFGVAGGLLAVAAAVAVAVLGRPAAAERVLPAR
ncbi:MFS transporter [Amnibacterium setariae]|uniref:MFS transporter n=1 Tax=Amnibacterium setariae TaxID=2306585 RepID=A0A3A1UDR9_9MICO|nr:MFS transporter [Amnibacterium setariae]RIX31226.1 hypothetical protein D1781_07685 [Amnibacterium setariae]